MRGPADKAEVASRLPSHYELPSIGRVEVRLIRPDDADRLYEFFTSLSERTRRWFCPHPFDLDTARRVASESGDPEKAVFLALDGDGRVVGYCFLHGLSRDYPSLGICVRDDVQNSGLGKALMRHLEMFAREAGRRGIELTVFKDNPRAQHLYRKMGYRTVGEADEGRQYRMRLDFSEPREPGDEGPVFVWHFQRAIEETYIRRDMRRGLERTFRWFVEEVGELARALRKGDHRMMEEEFSDVFAWLTTLASLVGVDMEQAARRYVRGCPKCGKMPCECPFE